MLFEQPKFRTLFKTHIDFVSTEKKDELPDVEMPEPTTRAEVKEQQKYKYLPGERLAMQLAKQSKKQKKKQKLNSDDVERITASMGKIMKIVS